MVKNKLHYELFWEYLKRSENYKDYCIWRQQTGTPLPEKLKRFRVQFESLYRLYGKIHSETFEKWWESNKNLFTFQKRVRVRNLKDIIGPILDMVIEKFRVGVKREPSPQEIKQYLVDYLNSNPERAFVEIDLWGRETSKELGEQVSKIISPLRKNKKVEVHSRFLNFLEWQPIPSTIKRPKSHFRYLAIYDMKYPGHGKKGLIVKEIAEKYYPQEDGKKEVNNPERIIYEILRFVKKNIKSAEHGILPS